MTQEYKNYQNVNLKTLINMLGAIMDKVDSMQKRIGNIRRKMDILIKNQKEMLEIKNTITNMKSAFNELIVD